MEKEKVNDAALRVQQQEEEMENTNKVSGASVLRFVAVHRLAAQLGFHTLHESCSCPGRGIRGHIEEPHPRAARIPVSNLLSRSALQLLTQKFTGACRRESEHQARLQITLQHLEQLKQQQQQRLHQGGVPSGSLLGLGRPGQGPEALLTAFSPFLPGMRQEQPSTASLSRQPEHEELLNPPVTSLMQPRTSVRQAMASPAPWVRFPTCCGWEGTCWGQLCLYPLLRRFGMLLGAGLELV